MTLWFKYQGLCLSQRPDGDWNVESLDIDDDNLRHGWGAPSLPIIVPKAIGLMAFGHLALTRLCEALASIAGRLEAAKRFAFWVYYLRNVDVPGYYIQPYGKIYRLDGHEENTLPDDAMLEWWSPAQVLKWIEAEDFGLDPAGFPICRRRDDYRGSLLDLIDQPTYDSITIEPHRYSFHDQDLIRRIGQHSHNVDDEQDQDDDELLPLDDDQ